MQLIRRREGMDRDIGVTAIAETSGIEVIGQRSGPRRSYRRSNPFIPKSESRRGSRSRRVTFTIPRAVIVRLLSR